MDSNVYTILLCGVGGQGTITAADLLARVATAAGLDCKVSEIHGMAQRGGAVTTVVRFGDNVSTMVCDEGCADSVVSFEIVEALRNISFLLFYFHNNRKNHWASLHLLPEVITQTVFNLCLDLGPVRNITVKTAL